MGEPIEQFDQPVYHFFELVDRLVEPIDRFSSTKMDGYCIHPVDKPVDRFSSTKMDGYCIHLVDKLVDCFIGMHKSIDRLCQPINRSMLNQKEWLLHPNSRLVYIDWLNPVDRFIDRKDYKFSFLAPLHILLSFPLSFSFLSLSKTLET